jgi:hypothetical protein
MNKFYFFLSYVLLLAGTAVGQCEIDYDFGDVGFGVSPDSNMGETFITGTVNEDYYDVLHILIPAFAADVDDSYPPTLPIDSIVLITTTLRDTVTWIEYTPEELGLEVTCNNNGDSGNPCSFLGGEQYCASIHGTPNMPGVFQINLNVDGWLTIFEPFVVQTTFSNFILNIHCNLIEDPIVVDANGDEGTLGSIDVTVLDGVNVISFEWTNSDGIVVGTSEDLGNLEPGVYSLTVVTDVCTSYFENIIIEDESIDCILEASTEVTDEIPGTSLGSIDLTVTGSNGDATYLWTDANGITVSTDEDLLNVSSGTYQVIITDEDGCILIISDLFVNIDSLEDIEIDNGVTVFPNPANSNVSITLESNLLTALEIRDVQGRLIFIETIVNSHNLNVSSWNQGIYFITTSNELGKSTSRLVIEK